MHNYKFENKTISLKNNTCILPPKCMYDLFQASVLLKKHLMHIKESFAFPKFLKVIQCSL